MTHDQDEGPRPFRFGLKTFGWAVLAALLLLIIGWLELSEPVRAQQPGLVGLRPRPRPA